MSLTEFSIIEKYFHQANKSRRDVVLGVGDDGAVVKVPNGYELVIAMDTLNSGVHFPTNTKPYDIGYKSVAVNLSDLAAMGAEPAWITLSLSMPQAEEKWIKDFSAGVFALLEKYDAQLIGGDTTQGSLSVTVQAHGFVPEGKALQRSGAKPGDAVYVTGSLGGAGLALSQQNVPSPILQKLTHPQPRINVGILLRYIASAAIDISDGLAADLNHILEKSGVGAVVNVEDLPMPAEFKKLDEDQALHLALTAGDDYELCFTVPQSNLDALEKIKEKLDCPVTRIGVVTSLNQLQFQYGDGSEYVIAKKGYQHFSS